MAKKVLIAGAGVAGPVLGIFLRRAGFEVELFEIADGLSNQGAGLGIAPNGIRVLQKAGVLEELRKVSMRAATWRFENERGGLLAAIPDVGEGSEFQSLMVMRPALQRVVVEEAKRQGVRFYYGKKAVAVKDELGGPLRVQFEDGSELQGDVLVAADGIRSSIRSMVMPDAPKPSYTGMIAPGGLSPCFDGAVVKANDAVTVRFVFGQRGFFGYFNTMTSSGPRTCWWSTYRASLPDRNHPAGKEELKARLLALHDGWRGPVRQLIEMAEEVLELAIHDVPSLPRWSVGRTVLIGDAAHAVAPHSGQGASMALEDAMLLAKMLRDSNGEYVQAVFAQFENERRQRTDRVIEVGRRNARRKDTMSSFEYWVMQQMMKVAIPLSHRRRQAWLLDYSIDW